MKLKANDQLHVSSVRAGTLRPGEEFEVGETIGKDLVKRKLATQVRAPRSKNKPKPANKRAPSPDNKGG